MGGKRFALLMCAEDSDYVKKKYGGYFGVYMALLAEEGDTWDMYRVARGEFPRDDEIETYDGFVTTGSTKDAHGNDEWVLQLIELLKKLDSMKKKVLAICFGHQLLSRALGGKTGRSPTGWDMGIRTINLSTSTAFLSDLKLPPQLSIIKCHRDEVGELPAKAEIIGWSGKTGIEMYRCGDHLLAIQGHPEYTKDILLYLMDLSVEYNLITESYAEEIRAELKLHEPDREAWRTLCIAFLKGSANLKEKDKCT